MAQLDALWDMKEVRYHDGRPGFVPKYHKRIGLGAAGEIGWHDGCNRIFGRYEISGESFRVEGLMTTDMYCELESEAVHFDAVTRFALEGTRLFLFTPNQTYVLERFPYSEMSEHAWSLYSITNRATGEVLDVDRFRSDYRHLLLQTERDRSFRFTDLNLDEFTGTLELRGSNILHMAYDQQSQERLSQRPERLAHLKDKTQRYRKTAELYPTTYAQRLDWSSVKTFEVVEGTIRFLNREVVRDLLLLHSEHYIYKFSPR